MGKDLICVYNEETGLWEESPEPFAIVEYTTEEDFEFMKAAVEHYGKHGKWIEWNGMDIPENHGRHKCSICGEFAIKPKYDEEILTYYCPNCGAKMMDEQ